MPPTSKNVGAVIVRDGDRRGGVCNAQTGHFEWTRSLPARPAGANKRLRGITPRVRDAGRI